MFTSCGEAYKEVAARHQKELEALEADLKKLADLVPETFKGNEVELTGAMDPLPKFDGDEISSNATILVWDQLADLEGDIDDEILNLYLDTGVRNCFVWSAWDQTASDSYEEDLKHAAAIRYLITYKYYSYVAPQVDQSMNYTVGAAAAGVFIYDREKGEVVCAFPVAAMSDPTINYTYKEGENKPYAAKRWARSNLWEKVRVKLIEELAAKTGGTFEK